MRRINTKKEFEAELLDAGERLVVVDFTASWCRKQETVTESLMYQPEFSEVLFLQVDVDDNEDTPPVCKIGYLPTIQLYRYGQKVAELYEDTLDNLKSALQLHR